MFFLHTASSICRDNLFLWPFYTIPGHDLPLKASLSHSLDTPHSVGLLWTSYHLTTHNTRNRQDIHAPVGIRTHNPSRGAAAEFVQIYALYYWV